MRHLILPFLLTTLLAGCGGNQKKEKEDDTTKPKVTTEAKGDPTIVATSPPRGFPAELPFYPGSKVLTQMSDPEVTSATLDVPDSADKVAAFYEKSFSKDGWTITSKINVGDALTLGADNIKTNKKCGVSINKGSDSTLVILALSRDSAVKVEPKDGPKTKPPIVSGVVLPKDFPEDVPLYPAGKVTATVNVTDIRSISLTTSDKAEKVVAYLEADAKKKGWKQFAKTQEESTTVLGQEKGEQIMTMSINQDEGETLIVITVTKKEK